MAFQKIIPILLTLFGLALGQNQRVVLYDQYDMAGNYFVIPETYAPDLSAENFDNRAHSACGTGIWIFYEERAYNPNGGRRVEYFVGENNDDCVNFLTLAGRVSSVRYVGNPKDYTIDSLTIFEHTRFQGREEYTYIERDHLTMVEGKHQSVIITGNSDWTVYDLPNFQGLSVCLTASNSPAFITDLQSTSAGPSIPYGSIKSVRKGCLSDNRVKMSSFGQLLNSL